MGLTLQIYRFYLIPPNILRYFLWKNYKSRNRFSQILFVTLRQILQSERRMNFLLIETSASICSAALAIDGKIISSYRNDEPMQHAIALPHFVEQALAEARNRNVSIEVIAVSGGPGSYTGLRIGVSTAKGLCYATGAKLVQVSTLQLIALRFTKGYNKLRSDAIIRPMIDARRMEVYTQSFTVGGQSCSEAETMIITPETFANENCSLYLCGSGASKCKNVVNNEKVFIIEGIEPIADEQMLILANEAVDNGCFEDVAYYVPFYLKEFYTTAKPISQ